MDGYTLKVNASKFPIEMFFGVCVCVCVCAKAKVPKQTVWNQLLVEDFSIFWTKRYPIAIEDVMPYTQCMKSMPCFFLTCDSNHLKTLH